MEADWPDAYRMNRYVRGEGDDVDAWKRWAVSSAFRNGCGATPMCSISSAGCASTMTARRRRPESGFYGLDLYSLHASIEAVLAYLDQSRPGSGAGARGSITLASTISARRRKPTASPPGFGMAPTCEDAVVNELVELRRKRRNISSGTARWRRTNIFCAEQNALVVRNAEQYYRNMFRRRSVFLEPARHTT